MRTTSLTIVTGVGWALTNSYQKQLGKYRNIQQSRIKYWRKCLSVLPEMGISHGNRWRHTWAWTNFLAGWANSRTVVGYSILHNKSNPEVRHHSGKCSEIGVLDHHSKLFSLSGFFESIKTDLNGPFWAILGEKSGSKCHCHQPVLWILESTKK